MSMVLPPAIKQGDLIKVGEIVSIYTHRCAIYFNDYYIWKLQTSGSKITEINKHGKNVGDLMKELYQQKIGVVGMSSVRIPIYYHFAPLIISCR